MPGYEPGTAFSLSSPFGTRNNPFDPSQPQTSHYGVDYSAAAGTAVPAASDGQVVYSGYNQSGFGYTVIIQSTGANDSPYYTLYGHLQPSDLPSVGNSVFSGQSIGYVGNTGNVAGGNDGNHLHFEVLQGNTPVANSDGGPLGFQGGQWRVDPDQFNNWNGGSPFTGGLRSNNGLAVEDAFGPDGTLVGRIIVPTLEGGIIYSNDGANQQDGVTDRIETFLGNADGSHTYDLVGLYATGGTQFEESIYTSVSGLVNATISGLGAVLNIDNATVNVTSGTQASFFGDGNNFFFDDNAFGSVFGDSNIFLGDFGSDFSIFGDDNLLILDPGQSASIFGDDELIYASGGDLTFGDGASGTIYGDFGTLAGDLSDVTTVDGIFADFASEIPPEYTLPEDANQGIFGSEGSDIFNNDGSHTHTGQIPTVNYAPTSLNSYAYVVVTSREFLYHLPC